MTDKENPSLEEQELLKEIQSYKTQQRIAKLKEELTNLKNPKDSVNISNCAICNLTTEQLIKIHVANYNERINPRIISKICQKCKDNKVIQASFYCPLTSDGYDGWAGPNFDCLCPVPVEKE